MAVLYLFSGCPFLSALFPYTTLFRSARVGSRHPPRDPRQQEPVFGRSDVEPLSAAVRDRQRRLAQDEALRRIRASDAAGAGDRKSTRLNSSHSSISYAAFCLKKKILH